MTSTIRCLATLFPFLFSASSLLAADTFQPGKTDGALPTFVRAEDGARACWRTEIGPSQLVAKPNRTVKSMALSMQTQVSPPDEDWPQGRTLYNYDLSITFSDGRSGRALGNCLPDGPDSIACAVECDGGGAIVSHRDGGAVYLDFSQTNFIRLNYCGEQGDPIRFRPDVAEARFTLQKRPEEECPAVTMPDWDAGID